MVEIDTSRKILDGLIRDPISGNYRVLPGYSQQLLRYAIQESWVDDDDDYFIAAAAVERELRAEEAQEQAQAEPSR